MRLVCNCRYLETRFIGPGSILQKYELYDIDEKKKYFEFDCRFLLDGSGENKKMIPTIKKQYDKVIPEYDSNGEALKVLENKELIIFPIRM